MRVKLLDCPVRSTSPDRHGKSVRVGELHRRSRAGFNAFERFSRALIVGRRARTTINSCKCPVRNAMTRRG